MRTNKLIFDSYFIVTLNLDHTYPSFYSYTLVDLDPILQYIRDILFH